MPNYLVVGGAGFIGSHLVSKLLAIGHNVRVLDNFSTGYRENLTDALSNTELVEGSAADLRTVAKVMDRIDGVFHLAAIPSVQLSLEQPLETQQSAEVATLTVLEAARRNGIKRVVYSSSCAVYGNSATRIDESAPRQPLSYYGFSKVAGEEYCRICSSLYPHLETVSLRYFNVFGARQSSSSPYSGVISIFLKCLRENISPTIYGDGRQSRDFIEVSNVVVANIAAMTSNRTFRGHCYNVGSGISTPVLDLWHHMAQVARSNLKPRFAEARPGDIVYSCADIARIEKDLGWQPEVSWKEGIARLWSETRALAD